MKKIIFSLAILCLGLADSTAYAKEDYAIVVNSFNNLGRTSSDMESEVFQIYLKKRTEWSSGIKAKPLKLDDDSPAQIAFNRRILEMELSEHDKYWQRMRNKGKTKPDQVRNLRTGLRMVKKDKGAFIMVPSNMVKKLPSGLTVLFYY